ncbi:MAG TPA: electron transport complex subunit RsxA [candidate division WOR-3 bacterium]|uniref:Ion-translocating oxidoreductase complex subunit A n=1 Tax=candidate division WOR-3 bacterium TaxID=2052148 RepID=A0A7C5M4M6_UNCW3|nr:electron transport complex subunit RsxA [Candidatus Hydrothermae bacterium]RKY98822.1 MAG: electron transport complex subunit RsxA [Candidatus Hydrothermae bacterium]HHF58393.1 electron transport complex subunit RsxA [candidate division WOR-3 bacterium]
MKVIIIFIAAAITNNFVLTYFLGLCPFLGVSGKASSAIGMGFASTFVMTLTAVFTWLLNHLILRPLHLEFLETVSFIFIIASLVQFVEMFIRKTSPGLYKALGIYLPLITTNCIVFGLALLGSIRNYNLLENTFFGFGAGVGFTIALVLMAGMREELEIRDVPEPLKGGGITLILAGLMALAFLGFSGMVTLS